MYNKELMELEQISQAVGSRVDYVQGGGGNTSVKLSDGLMAVKASGFKLNQLTQKEGYVVVNYENIRKYYEGVDISQDVDFEKQSVEVAKQNIVTLEGLKVLRPSVEAGFHSILKKYVIHTHPVYANILCCGKEGQDIISRIFSNKYYSYLWIPYINPGFCLTLRIKDGIRECAEKEGRFPEVIFMENHGLIVTSDDFDRAMELHDEINNLIREYFRIPDEFPEVRMEQLNDNVYRSNTCYLIDFFRGRDIDFEYFEKFSLYPDQLVYLNGNLSINGAENKLNINTKTGELVYKSTYSEALTIEETLLGYLYVINGINTYGLTIKTMTQKEIDFIKNWESEAYRKSLVKNLK